MKKVLLLSFVSLLSLPAWSVELDVEITSLTNIKGNGAMEVCGTVTGQQKATSLVTLKHDESYYTTLTSKEGKWCQVIRRWTYDGKTSAVVRSL